VRPQGRRKEGKHHDHINVLGGHAAVGNEGVAAGVWRAHPASAAVAGHVASDTTPIIKTLFACKRVVRVVHPALQLRKVHAPRAEKKVGEHGDLGQDAVERGSGVVGGGA